LVFYQNPLIAKTTLLRGRNFIMGKRGIFWPFIKTSLERYFDLPKQNFFDIEIGKWICLVKTNQVVAKWSKYAKSLDNLIGFKFEINLHFLARIWIC
jgi:hypothetical protein